MVTTIVVRELLIQGLRSHLEGQGPGVRGQDGGQAQDARSSASRSRPSCSASAVQPSPAWLLARDVLTWSAVGLTVYSGLGYVALAMPKLQGRARLVLS